VTVAIGSVGPSSSGKVATTAATSWTHPGTDTAVLVWLVVGTNGSAWAAYSYSGVTCDGNAMTLLGSVESGPTTATAGGIFCYGITGQTAGTHAIAATLSITPSVSQIGFSEGFTGAGSFGTAVTGHNPTSSNVASSSIAVTGTTSGGLVAAGICTGSGGEAWTAGTQRFKLDDNGSSAAGNTSGATSPSTGGTVTPAWTMTSDWYGGIAVEVKAATVVDLPPAIRPYGTARGRQPVIRPSHPAVYAR
jgi:hypothetical protein